MLSPGSDDDAHRGSRITVAASRQPRHASPQHAVGPDEADASAPDAPAGSLSMRMADDGGGPEGGGGRELAAETGTAIGRAASSVAASSSTSARSPAPSAAALTALALTTVAATALALLAAAPLAPPPPVAVLVFKLKRHCGHEESCKSHRETHCSWKRCLQGSHISVSSSS